MAYCTKCGKKFEEGEKFCTNCGAPMNGEIEIKNENENKSEGESENDNEIKNEGEILSPPVQSADNRGAVSFWSAKKSYILGALVFAVLAGIFVYISSTPKEPADVGMQKFCKAYINGDSEMLKLYDKDPELGKLPVKERIKEVMKEEIKKEMKDMASIMPNADSEMEKFFSAFINALADKIFTNNNVTCRLIEQKGKEAKVEVTVDTYDFDFDYMMNRDMEKRAEDRLKKILLNKPSLRFNREELWKEFWKVYTETMIEVIDEMKPVKRSNFVVDCVYNSETGVWKPKDLKIDSHGINSFENKVGKMAAPNM